MMDALPDLHVQGDTLREHQSSLESDRRDLSKVRRQAIVLGRYLYANRRRLRAERLSWAEHYQFPRPEKTQT